jgi:Lrp/AsnC family leucine-responsive transcriptional regulator
MDKIDLNILDLLQDQGRMPFSEIANKVNLTPPSIMERIKKLEDKGIIKKYTAILDAKKLGNDISAFIGVYISHPRYIEEFERGITKYDDILESHHVTGEYTLLLKVKTKNTTTLEALIREIRSMKGVTRTLTTIVLSTRKEETRVNIKNFID